MSLSDKSQEIFTGEVVKLDFIVSDEETIEEEILHTGYDKNGKPILDSYITKATFDVTLQHTDNQSKYLRIRESGIPPVLGEVLTYQI